MAALATLAVFVGYGLDVRTKRGVTPLAPLPLTRIMKIVSSALVALYAYVLWTLQALVSTDALALALTLAGAALVRAAKLELGASHTWTGYCIESPRLVRSGVYGYLRHPLYAGVYLFEIGAVCTFLPRASVLPRWAAAIAVVGLVFAMIFNAAMATLETRRMATMFGREFERYCARVRAFMPLRRRVHPA